MVWKLRVDIILAAINLIAYGGIVNLHCRYGTLRGHTPDTLTWYALAFVVYLVAILWAERRRAMSSTLAWDVAIAFRAALLLTTPITTWHLSVEKTIDSLAWLE